MKVILLQNIKGVGRMGDIKNVSDGYGKNFLIPKKLAKIANDNTIEEAKALRKKAEVREKIVAENAKVMAEKVKDSVIEFTKKTSKTGTLFASVTKEEVAGKLSSMLGGKVEADDIDFKDHGEHIKHEGEHIVEADLAPGVKIQVKIVIKGE